MFISMLEYTDLAGQSEKSMGQAVHVHQMGNRYDKWYLGEWEMVSEF